MGKFTFPSLLVKIMTLRTHYGKTFKIRVKIEKTIVKKDLLMNSHPYSISFISAVEIFHLKAVFLLHNKEYFSIKHPQSE